MYTKLRICREGLYTSDYKSRLISLNMLPLMTWLELNDVVFFVSCTKSITAWFIAFSCQKTRSSDRNTMIHCRTRTNASSHFYFNRLHCIFNALPAIDPSMSSSLIKSRLKCFLWNHFKSNFDSTNTCSFHFMCPCHKCMSIPTPN